MTELSPGFFSGGCFWEKIRRHNENLRTKTTSYNEYSVYLIVIDGEVVVASRVSGLVLKPRGVG